MHLALGHMEAAETTNLTQACHMTSTLARCELLYESFLLNPAVAVNDADESGGREPQKKL